MSILKTNIDTQIKHGFVYEVTIKTEADKTVSFFQTTFNLKQPEVAIKRAIKASGLKSADCVTVSMIRQLTESNL